MYKLRRPNENNGKIACQLFGRALALQHRGAVSTSKTEAIAMPPAPAKPKKKSTSPTKKKKPAVKADYGGVYFGEKSEEPAEPVEEPEYIDDPLASYRAAAAAAQRAAEKERKEEAKSKLYRKIFAAMDSDRDGKVEMADMVERVAAGTAQLSHRAQQKRPEGAVALQLPMVFGLNEWLKEMKRMASQMDEETFEQNVLGLFECFATADDVDGAPSPAPVVLGMPKTVNNNSSAAEDAEDKKENGLAAMRGALKSWRATTATTPRGTPIANPPAGTSAAAAQSDDLDRVTHGVDRDAMLREIFATMDTDGDGLIDLNDFLTQAKSSEEANELRSLFHFFDSNFAAPNYDGQPGAAPPPSPRSYKGETEAKLNYESFKEGTLSRTPMGRMRDSTFASAARGMLKDIKHALSLKAAAAKRLNLLQELFTTLDVKGEGQIDVQRFASTAKSEDEAAELRETFKEFDESVDGGKSADGNLTFRKFATGTMTCTPLGKMKDDAFEKAISDMIGDAKKAVSTVDVS